MIWSLLYLHISFHMNDEIYMEQFSIFVFYKGMSQAARCLLNLCTMIYCSAKTSMYLQPFFCYMLAKNVAASPLKTFVAVVCFELDFSSSKKIMPNLLPFSKGKMSFDEPHIVYYKPFAEICLKRLH